MLGRSGEGTAAERGRQRGFEPGRIALRRGGNTRHSAFCRPEAEKTQSGPPPEVGWEPTPGSGRLGEEVGTRLHRAQGPRGAPRNTAAPSALRERKGRWPGMPSVPREGIRPRVMALTRETKR